MVTRSGKRSFCLSVRYIFRKIYHYRLQRKSVFRTQQGSCTYEATAVVTADTSPYEVKSDCIIEWRGELGMQYYFQVRSIWYLLGRESIFSKRCGLCKVDHAAVGDHSSSSIWAALIGLINLKIKQVTKLSVYKTGGTKKELERGEHD